jgi:hypothetical protein
VATNLSAEVRHATNYLSCGDDSGKLLFFRNGGECALGVGAGMGSPS